MDYSSITDVAQWPSAALGIVAISAAMAGVYVVSWGARALLDAFSGDGEPTEEEHPEEYEEDGSSLRLYRDMYDRQYYATRAWESGDGSPEWREEVDWAEGRLTKEGGDAAAAREVIESDYSDD